MIKKLIESNRTCRRFDPKFQVTYEDFLRLVELARLSASAANRQTLRFAFAELEKAAAVFDNIKWAGYIQGGAPSDDKKPPAYILVLNDNSFGNADLTSAGIAMQSMLLGAAEMGLRGCIFGSINKLSLHKALKLDDNIEIVNVIALGKPAETAVIEDIRKTDSIKYWRDDDGVFHVPKIIAEDLIIKL